MVQFCNVNSCQSLKCIFFFHKEHFLASNELGNWHQILFILSLLNVKNKQTKNRKTKTTSQEGLKIAQLNLNVNYTIYRLVFTSLQYLGGCQTLLRKNSLYRIPILMTGKQTRHFLLYRYERGSEKAKLRDRCCPMGNGGIWLFWSLYQRLPHPQARSSSRWTTRFSWRSALERWTPLLQQQGPRNKAKGKVDGIIQNQFSYQVKHVS